MPVPEKEAVTKVCIDDICQTLILITEVIIALKSIIKGCLSYQFSKLPSKILSILKILNKL